MKNGFGTQRIRQKKGQRYKIARRKAAIKKKGTVKTQGDQTMIVANAYHKNEQHNLTNRERRAPPKYMREEGTTRHRGTQSGNHTGGEKLERNRGMTHTLKN